MPSFPIQRAVIGSQRGLGSVLLSSTDPAAQAIINGLVSRGGTVSGAAQTAINTFVTDCKTDGSWNNRDHIYGFVGGTNASHAMDWKNPSGTDIVWHGSVTSDANGSHGDGTSYGDLGFSLSGMTTTDANFSIYSRTSGSGSGLNMGVDDGVAFFWLGVNHNGNADAINGLFGSRSTTANTAAGMLTLDVSGSSRNILLNGSAIVSDSTTVFFPANNLWCFGRNDNGALADSSSNNVCFISSGSSLGSSGSTQFRTRVQALQTSLGRQV